MTHVDIQQDWYAGIAESKFANRVAVNKYGRATDADSGIDCDIWNRCNSTDNDDIWTAPTTARTHDITSTSTNDDGAPAGTGLQTLRVHGLTGWSSDRVTEDITMDGTSNVATSNAYVLIDRLEPLTWGTAGPNVGTITATAQTDATVTAQIEAGRGQTEMAVFGVPDTQVLYIKSIYSELIKIASVNAEVNLLVNSYADTQLAGFVSKSPHSTMSQAPLFIQYDPPLKFAGPSIVKLQINTDTNNCTVTGGFNGYLVDA